MPTPGRPAKVRVRCLGPGKEHTFLTTTPRGNRLCAVDDGDERTIARLTVLRSGARWRIRSPVGAGRRCTRVSVPEDVTPCPTISRSWLRTTPVVPPGAAAS